MPNLYEVVMEEKENLWKIEFCNASQCPYFSSWWHNKREFQKVIVEGKVDDSFAQKCSIQQRVNSALNCSSVVLWERPRGFSGKGWGIAISHGLNSASEFTVRAGRALSRLPHLSALHFWICRAGYIALFPRCSEICLKLCKSVYVVHGVIVLTVSLTRSRIAWEDSHVGKLPLSGWPVILLVGYCLDCLNWCKENSASKVGCAFPFEGLQTVEG